ncbi:MAG: hypothetical protein LBD45_06650 [Bacteroidales bacterium]|nr:hypothetical protein [Bacteroidales bacterium]
MRKVFFITVLNWLYLTTSFVYSQSIGINTENPNQLTDLDVQNVLNSQGDTIPRGIMIPRMTETQRNSINVTNKSTANSLIIYNIDEDCYNYYMRSENEWRSLCGTLGNAVFTVSCGSISVNGTYIINTATDGTHYVLLTVDVTKKGIWSIVATSNPNNGYSFVGQGVFTSAGQQTVKLVGQGKPAAVRTDAFSFDSSSGGGACNFSISIKPQVAIYALHCANAVVNGTYKKNTPLTSSPNPNPNTISISVGISTAGYCEIKTPVTNGIWFEYSDIFLAGDVGTTKTVNLQGYGTPTVNYDFPITVLSNSPERNNICSITIPIIFPPMTYAIIGLANDAHTWNADKRKNSFVTALSQAGVVKIQSFTMLWNSTTANNAETLIRNGYNGGQYPDVVLYFADGINPDINLSATLANYVNKGGVLIFGAGNGTQAEVKYLLNGIFGSGMYGNGVVSNIDGSITINMTGTFGLAVRSMSYRNDYRINTLPNDQIINGPFGDLSGKYWGEDEGNSVFVTQLPPGSTQICSVNNPGTNKNLNPDYSIVWYNDSKNFMYFGDCAAVEWDTNTSKTDYPTIYNQATGLPKSKPFGYWVTTSTASGASNPGEQYVCNGALELNAVAWAIQRAAVAGINPH